MLKITHTPDPNNQFDRYFEYTFDDKELTFSQLLEHLKLLCAIMGYSQQTINEILGNDE